MLKVYKYPETPDQDQPNSGDLLFGIQDGKSVTPLPFFTNGNNSTIVSFTAVEFDQFRNEINRISLDTSIIDVDIVNNIYNVDGVNEYFDFLENGVYRFEFQNDSNLWKTEYFKVTDEGVFIPTVLITMNPTNNFTVGFDFSFTGNLYFDFKDGEGIEPLISGVEKTHLYLSSGIYIGEVTGSIKTATSLICNSSKITAIEIEKLISLEVLLCDKNNILALDVANLTALQTLRCNINNISILNVTNLINLTLLRCESNNISALDVANLTNLTQLRCNNNNNISVLNVTNLTNLTILYCYVNNIPILDVTNLTNLNILLCNDNNISVLNVTNLTNLTNLWCYNNNISVLDVTNLTALTTLQCNDNSIVFLDVELLVNLIDLDLTNNGMLSSPIDNIYIGLDTAGANNGELKAVTGNSPRTAASDTAYNNLIARGWTLI